MVTVRRRSVIVEASTVVSVCCLVMKDSKEKELVFQAVRIPPREPDVPKQWKDAARVGGRKVWAL